MDISNNMSTVIQSPIGNINKDDHLNYKRKQQMTRDLLVSYYWNPTWKQEQ